MSHAKYQYLVYSLFVVMTVANVNQRIAKKDEQYAAEVAKQCAVDDITDTPLWKQANATEELCKIWDANVMEALCSRKVPTGKVSREIAIAKFSLENYQVKIPGYRTIQLLDTYHVEDIRYCYVQPKSLYERMKREKEGTNLKRKR